MNEPINSQINLANYPEKCPDCGSPARWEMTIDERHGLDNWLFCINPKCWAFDHSNLQHLRALLVKAMQHTKGYQRHYKKVSKQAVVFRRKNRVSLYSNMA